MKATIRELMGSRVNRLLFLLACLLLAGVGVAAKLMVDELASMADDIVLAVGRTSPGAATPGSPALEEDKSPPGRDRAPAARAPAQAPVAPVAEGRQ